MPVKGTDRASGFQCQHGNQQKAQGFYSWDRYTRKIHGKITKKSLDEKKKELLKNAESVEEFYLFDEDFDTQKDFKTEFLSMMKL